MKRSNQSTHVLFTLSNPLDELKPVLCKSFSGDCKLVLAMNIFPAKIKSQLLECCGFTFYNY